jgi:multidrug resistance efflux pump
VQRVPVRVRLSHRQDEPPLRAGMSADIAVAVGQRQHGLGRLLSALGLGSAEAAEAR